MFRSGAIVFAAGSLATLLMPVTAVAAPPPGGLTAGWVTAEIDHFKIHVQSESASSAEVVAQTYGIALETAYRELTLVFPDGAPAAKIDLYVFAESAAFQSATASIVQDELERQTVFADWAANDLSLYLPSFEKRSDIETENQLRHALSHLVTAVASDGKIPPGFDEGIARYIERPVNESLARIAALVQTANRGGDRLSWVDMNHPSDSVDAELAAAQSYSTVAYLIDNYELAPLRAFLTELKTATNWRDAMRIAYERDPIAIEKAWRENLPRWTTTNWRENLISGFDLKPAQTLLSQANFVAAKEALDPAQRLLRQVDAPDELGFVEHMIAQCDIGIQAESLMTQTQQALAAHAYDRAMNLLVQAKQQFSLLPEVQQPVELLATYDEMATAGLAAGASLELANQLKSSWRDYPGAREAALDAGATYARLGDEDGVNGARAVLDDVDTRQRQIVLALGALSVLTLAWLGLWVWARGPDELDWR